jgi:hypothetical protein
MGRSHPGGGASRKVTLGTICKPRGQGLENASVLKVEERTGE